MNRETIIEVMARAMCLYQDEDPDRVLASVGKDGEPLTMWKHWKGEASAALAAIEAAGVRLVPAKCTDDMAGYAGARAEARGDIRMLPGEYRAAWEAMLAASPYAPPEG